MQFSNFVKTLAICFLFITNVSAKEIVIGDKLFIATLNDIYTNLEEEYKDDTVTFEGNLSMGQFDDPEYEGQEFPFVYRMGPGCCYNDVFAGMYLEYKGQIPPEDTWVRVSGKPYYFEHNGFTDLFLKVEKLTPLKEKGMFTVKD